MSEADAVSVSNGLFTVSPDLGASVFNGGATVWLQIAVRTNNSASFTNLASRQLLTATPYAITASNVTGSVPTKQLAGTISTANLSGTYSGAVTFNNPADQFAGNGGGVTNVNAVQLGGLRASNFWGVGGNSVGAGQHTGRGPTTRLFFFTPTISVYFASALA